MSFPLRIQDIEEEDVPDKHGPPDLSNLGKFYILRKRIDAPMVARRNIALAKLVEKQGSAYIDVLNLRGSRGPQMSHWPDGLCLHNPTNIMVAENLLIMVDVL